MKKMFGLGACLMLIGSLHAQFQFYKIEKGVKTPIKGGEYAIVFDDNLKPTNNVLLEVNVAEFKKKYSYNLFGIEVFEEKNNKRSELLTWQLIFESEFYKSKYGADKILRYYLFPDENTAKDPKAMVYYSGKESYNTFSMYVATDQDTLSFQMYGRYKTGSETYYDERSETIKDRDLFTDPEDQNIPEAPVIRYVLSEKLKKDYQQKLDDERYEKTIANSDNHSFQQSGNYYSTLYGIDYNLRKESNHVLSYTIGGISGASQYPQISKAIVEISDYKEKQIKAEPDHAKALQMMEEWGTNYKKLIVIDNLTPEQRKQLNKDLKATEDVATKLDLFMKL